MPKDLYEVQLNGEWVEVEADSPEDAASWATETEKIENAKPQRGNPAYLMETVKNIPSSARDLAVDAYEGVKTLGGQVVDAARGNTDPLKETASNLIPGVVDHYSSRYSSPEARERTVRDDPAGMVADMTGVTAMGKLLTTGVKKGTMAAGRRAARASQNSPLMAAATGESGMLARMRRYVEGIFDPDLNGPDARKNYVLKEDARPDRTPTVEDFERYSPSRPADSAVPDPDAAALPLTTGIDRYTPNTSNPNMATTGGHVVGHMPSGSRVIDPEDLVASHATSRIPYGIPDEVPDIPEVPPSPNVGGRVGGTGPRQYPGGDIERAIREALEQARRPDALGSVELGPVADVPDPGVILSLKADRLARGKSTTPPAKKKKKKGKKSAEAKGSTAKETDRANEDTGARSATRSATTKDVPRTRDIEEPEKRSRMFGGVSTGDPLRRFPREPLSTRGKTVGVEYDPSGLDRMREMLDILLRRRQ